MRIVTFKTIWNYSQAHPEAYISLNEWYVKTKRSEWHCFADIKQTFNSVDSVGNNRFVFNIKGNDFRLIAIVIYASQKVYVRFIGTHSEYDKIKDCSII
jgi:mRNA interferase HigB